MRVDWLGPLVALAFLVGMAASAVLVRLGRIRHPGTIAGALALPFGCAVVPLALLVLASLAHGALGSLFP
ncbi:hypothetical protein EDF56_10618 [Novosphingobium sp. PhB165]|uniref:hypothetical protein n=1 Tax=Novosphingobium sp. PhB165 TaxID=2485105 RepID=UPI00104D3D5B|nr:hypothetical protein [Novosphingobium sp. PhB165]TCM16906.1 hypothetical protein EDF56_10618 [Novosphingobium sp. PhB165]